MTETKRHASRVGLRGRGKERGRERDRGSDFARKALASVP